MNIKRAATFGYYLGKAYITRSLPYLLSGMLLPLGILFIFSLVSGGALLKYAILGGFISIVSVNALSTMFDAARMRMDFKFQDVLVASKVTSTDFMLSLGISNMFFSLPSLLVYLVIAIAFGVFTVSSFVLTIIVLIPLVIATTAIGFSFSYIPSHFRNIYGVFNIVSLLLTFVPPIFYPYSVLPKPLLYIFAISPATPAAVLIQNIVGFEKFGPISYVMIVILLVETVICTIIAKRLIKWRQP